MEEHSPPREVCLRTEFAHVYPGLPAGEWIGASRWAAAIVDRAQQARSLNQKVRTFDSRHFEVRGGPGPRVPGERQLRTRAEDR